MHSLYCNPYTAYIILHSLCCINHIARSTTVLVKMRMAAFSRSSAESALKETLPEFIPGFDKNLGTSGKNVTLEMEMKSATSTSILTCMFLASTLKKS